MAVLCWRCLHTHTHTFHLPQKLSLLGLTKFWLNHSPKCIRLLAAQFPSAVKERKPAAFLPVMTDSFSFTLVYFAAHSVKSTPTRNINHTKTCLVHSWRMWSVNSMDVLSPEGFCTENWPRNLEMWCQNVRFNFMVSWCHSDTSLFFSNCINKCINNSEK